MNLLPYLLAALSSVLPLSGQEVIILSPDGQPIVIEVDQNDRFLDTVDMLRNYFATDSEYLVDFKTPSASVGKAIGAKIAPRNYNAKPTSKEMEDIRYIMTTLGMGSLIKIAKESSSLKKAGKRVEHIHPLKFLQIVFSNEEYKACMHALVGRTWVWSEFWDGMRDSFETESNRDNMKPEIIYDFSSKVGINPDSITPSINKKQWNQLIDILIAKIPRNINAGRYEM